MTIPIMRFTKMHGCGNDYVYVDAWDQSLPDDLPGLARAVSDRHRGIGGDGLIVVGPSAVADARMTMFNADGSSSEMCGNGLRCAARLAWDHGRLRAPTARFETGAGVLDLRCLIDAHGRCDQVEVAMGEPRLDPAAVPVDVAGPGPLLRVPLDLGDDRVEPVAVGMGNPHAVIVVEDVERAPVERLGRLIEHHPRFPRRTNVEFVARLRDEGGRPVLRQRTWERGSGETQACGTGACAAVVAGVLTGLLPPGETVVRLDGGDLRVTWPGKGQIHLRGEAVKIYSGDWPL